MSRLRTWLRSVFVWRRSDLLSIYRRASIQVGPAETAFAAYVAKDYELAKRRFLRILENAPTNDDRLFALRCLAEIEYKLGELTNALQLADRSLAESPDLYDMHILRGGVLLAAGNITEAERAFRRGIDLSIAVRHDVSLPESAREFYAVTKGQIATAAFQDFLLSQGRVDDAFRFYDEMRVRNPELADLWATRVEDLAKATGRTVP